MRHFPLPVIVSLILSAAVPAVPGETVIADFEGDDYGAWTATGKAFGPGPARGTLAGQNTVSGFKGRGLVNTFYKGDRTRGTLTSPPFTIQRRYISFLVGGGGHGNQTVVQLLAGNKVVRAARGRNREQLEWATWDVVKLKGRTTRIRIVDDHTGGWGHINVDHIIQSDRPRGKTWSPPVNLTGRLKDLPFDEIVFAARQDGKDGHWYANFSYWSSHPKKKLYGDGGKLCRLNIRTGKVRVILDDPAGGVRDPQLHYDGKKILFSYRRGGQPFYHLCEINSDGTGLRQLTDGPFDDIEPAYLPDGGIVFCSSRCNRMVNCWHVRVAVIYRCDADGGTIRALSTNIEQDNTPWVLPDGRILYQRWEYIDRSQVRFHHLWTMNPDGTGQMVFFGNMHPGTVMIDAKPIPGTEKVVASFSPGHGKREHEGVITVVDPRNGPDDRRMAKAITPGKLYRDPYPLAEDLFLAATGTRIVLVDGRGGTMDLYTLPGEWSGKGLRVQEPRPLRGRRRERVISPQIDTGAETADVVLIDVNIGRNMKGVARGDIKKLLILEALPKPVNFTGGWEPITLGGSFTLERILGTVPVEEDGSAHMKLPAMRSLFFVALDANDLAVKRMQSFLTVQPGEKLSCVGCHENRGETPQLTRLPKAMGRPASRIEPIGGLPYIIDFPRDIQPILDRHCVGCHDYDGTDRGGPRSGGVILSGDRGGVYSHSYFSLTVAGQIADGRNGNGNRAPRTLGSSASRIMDKIDGAHHEVTVSARERKLVWAWIETAACYPGTYAALGSGMVGATDRSGDRSYRKAWGARTDRALKRCAKCHEGRKAIPPAPDKYTFGFGGGHVRPGDPRYRFDPNILMNLTRPVKSLMLLVPLAASRGGYATGEQKGAKKKGHPIVFKDTADPDYRCLLDAIGTTGAYLDEIKRFDMPGFRPNEHYLREMKRYGILPADPGPGDPVDCYDADRRYWESFHHRAE